MTPTAHVTGWPLAHLLDVVPVPGDVLSDASPNCPKCGAEATRVLFYPKSVGLCSTCDLVWRLPEPRTVPDLERVKEELKTILAQEKEARV